MAEPEVDTVESDGADDEMEEAEAIEEGENDGEEGEATGLEDVEPTIAERVTFLEYVCLRPSIDIPQSDSHYLATSNRQ